MQLYMYGKVMKNPLVTYSASERNRQPGSKHEVGLPAVVELDSSVVVVDSVVMLPVVVDVALTLASADTDDTVDDGNVDTVDRFVGVGVVLVGRGVVVVVVVVIVAVVVVGGGGGVVVPLLA